MYATLCFMHIHIKHQQIANPIWWKT